MTYETVLALIEVVIWPVTLLACALILCPPRWLKRNRRRRP